MVRKIILIFTYFIDRCESMAKYVESLVGRVGRMVTLPQWRREMAEFLAEEEERTRVELSQSSKEVWRTWLVWDLNRIDLEVEDTLHHAVAITDRLLQQESSQY